MFLTEYGLTMMKFEVHFIFLISSLSFFGWGLESGILMITHFFGEGRG